MRIRQKGTNVYMMSFQDKSSWLITQPPSSFQLMVLEPTENKDAAIFVLEPQLPAKVGTNAAPAAEPPSAVKAGNG